MSGFLPFLTASRVDLFSKCQASAVLPRTEETSEAAERGTTMHAAVLRVGHLPQVALDWFGHEPRYEVALAWRQRDGAALFLGTNLERDYEVDSNDWLAGTADALSVRGGVISVADLKTGHAQTRGVLGPPEKSGQLRLLAWLIWRLILRAGPLDVQIPETWWRPSRIRLAWLMRPEDGEPWIEDAEVEPDELEEWARRLAARAQAAQANVPAMRPGDHCRFCQCFDACPAMGGALRRLSDGQDGPVTDDDAAVAHASVAAAERTISHAKRALSVYVERRGGVPLGGGRELQLTRSTIRKIDPEAAIRSGLVPPSAARVSVTQESIREAMPAADLDEVMDRLREAGAVSEITGAPYLRVMRSA